MMMVYLIPIFLLTLTHAQLVIGQASDICFTNGTIRLVDGNSELLEGRLEVCVNGEWGTVCDLEEDWTQKNSDVVCRQLMRQLGQTEVTVEAYFNFFGGGRENQRIFYDDIECFGNETELTSCPIISPNAQGCLHAHDVGISCIEIPSSLSVNDLFNYDDMVTCTDPRAINLTESEVFQNGQCSVYVNGLYSNPCDAFYTRGISRVYIPEGRGHNRIDRLNEFSATVGFVLNSFQEPCRDPIKRMFCYYYYPPCGTLTKIEPPRSFCQKECEYLMENCQADIETVQERLNSQLLFIERFSLQFINCSNPGAPLDPLPHCCSNAGVYIPSSDESGTEFPVTLAVTVAVLLSIALFLVVVIITVFVCIVVKRSSHSRPTKTRVVLSGSRLTLKSTDHALSVDSDLEEQERRYVAINEAKGSSPAPPGMPISQLAKVSAIYINRISEANLLVPGRHIKLMDCVGKGQFGIVFRSYLSGWSGTSEVVAVKTLNAMFSDKDIEDLMEESLKMKSFSHPNVLNLIGVCIDAGEVPYIVMPYMANGSLLSYLRKERPNLIISEKATDDLVTMAKKTLLSMCLQIAKGMEYLASNKIVHRDLAARNCMIDINHVIKVADFGLSEDICLKNYFRQGHQEGDSEVKLPIKWMAIESLNDGVFTEKTDVWSYGVTCWEVFTLGRTPYPAMDPFTLLKYLEDGQRMDKPSNAACTDDVYNYLMTSCWHLNPEKRPLFSDLVQSANTLLEGLSDYLTLSSSFKNSQ